MNAVVYRAMADELLKIAEAVLQTGPTGRPTISSIEKDIQERGAKKDPSLSIQGLKKTPLGVVQGFKVYRVDGEWVRNNISVLFGSGGHGLVHEFIPMTEIWADKAHSLEYQQSTILHEIHEHLLMRKKLPYWHAHESARKAEREVRPT